MNERPCSSRQSGIMLLEVLVAFAVLSLSMAGILAVYSSAFRARASAQEHAIALQIAEAKLEEIRLSAGVGETHQQGTAANRYEWTAVVEALDWEEPEALVEHPLQPYAITVTVSWTEGEGRRGHNVSLSTIRLAGQT